MKFYDVNTSPSPRRVRIFLAEKGVEFETIPVDTRNMAHLEPDFLKLSPNHKIPALIDAEGPGGAVSIFESGAILKYVSEKSDNGLYPSAAAKQVEVDQWLFFGSATFTTLAQQFGAWVIRLPMDVAEAKEHYTNILKDMLSTLDTRLADNEYLAGDYSVADISCYPDIHIHGINDIGLDDYSNVKRWHDAVAGRPAVKRAWVPLEVG